VTTSTPSQGLRPEPSSDRAPVLAAALIAFFMAALTSFFSHPEGKPGGQEPPLPGREAEGQRGDQGKGLQRRLRESSSTRTDPANCRFHVWVLLHEGPTNDEPSTIIASKGTLVSNPQSLTVTSAWEKWQHPHSVDPGSRTTRNRFQHLRCPSRLQGSAAQEKRVKFSKIDEMTLWDLRDQIDNPSPSGPSRRELMIEFNSAGKLLHLPHLRDPRHPARDPVEPFGQDEGFPSGSRWYGLLTCFFSTGRPRRRRGSSPPVIGAGRPTSCSCGGRLMSTS